jgi:hypothetical protein
MIVDARDYPMKVLLLCAWVSLGKVLGLLA